MTAQHSTAQHSIAQHSATQHSTAQRNTPQYLPSCQLQEEPLQWVVQAKCQHVSQHYYTHSQPVNRKRLAEKRTPGWFPNCSQLPTKKIKFFFFPPFCKCFSRIFVSYIWRWWNYFQVFIA